MATKKDILEDVLTQSFDLKRYMKFIREFFNSLEEKSLTEKTDIATKFMQFSYTIASYHDLARYTDSQKNSIAILAVKLKSGRSVERARSVQRNFVSKIITDASCDAAIVAFYTEGDTKWRLSFVRLDQTWDKGKFKTTMTPAKRYSYLVGEKEPCRTAKDRLFPIFENEDFNPTLDKIEEAFSVETLTEEFYEKLFKWYQWAMSEEMGVTYPNDTSTEKDDRIIEEHLIRLIIRLIFVWFIKQKHLIPNEIFDTENLSTILKNFDPQSKKSGNYYNAVLQNLFFTTLNRPIDERAFASDASKSFQGKNEHYGIKTLFRDAKEGTYFNKSPKEIIALFRQVPFLNGGLFECLDKEQDKNGKIFYYDGFSREKGRQKRTFIPNVLFFDEEKGLIPLLKRYNFTIEENTPSDVDVALDPELLGKVFENLLGTYNPETQETARKQSGSFYTPREIVNYMVNESLVSYLKQTIGEEWEAEYRNLMNDDAEPVSLTKSQMDKIYNALRDCKILDPACGSGAFPMGILNRIVTIMERMPLPAHISIFDIKLYLIENCIFGVDIQSIAVQISKLRFFISLVCEQTPNENSSENYGIKPLPNLETKFVAANTLIGLNTDELKGTEKQTLFEDPQITVTRKDLLQIRHNHFSANTPKEKKTTQENDEKLRNKLADLLEKEGTYNRDDALQLAAWNPYDQNASSPFFDPEWMFGIKDGFDIVIGNPPYLKEGRVLKEVFDGIRGTIYYQGKMDLWYVFACMGIDFLTDTGHLCFIATNNWITNAGASKLRNKVIADTKIIQLIDFGNLMIFESASIQTMVMLFQKNKNADKYSFDYRKLQGDTELSDAVCLLQKGKNKKAEYLSPTVVREYLMNSFLVFSKSEDIFEKIAFEKVFLTEKEVAQGIVPNPDVVNNKNIAKIPQTKLQKYNIKVGDGVFVVDKKKFEDCLSNEKKYIKPLYEPTEIEKFKTGHSKADIIYITKSNFQKDAPNLIEHLEKYKEIMEERRENLNGRLEFFHLHWSRDASFFEEGEKILSIRKCEKPTFAYTTEDCYVMLAVNIIKTERFNMKYLLGLFNSRLMMFWLKNKGKMQGANFQLDKEPLLGMPIQPISKNQEKPFITLVDQILAAKTADPMADTAALENMIDALVFMLYGLAEDEMLTVLLSLNVSEAERREIQTHYKTYKKHS